MTKKIHVWIKFFGTYLAIAGLITFSLFILEEAFQTTMFGTWPAQDAQQWEIVYNGVQLMDSIITVMVIINYSVGYIQPLAFISYAEYAKSAEYYTKALRAKVFAHKHELFLNQTVSFEFFPKEIRLFGNKFLLINNKLAVICNKLQKSNKLQITGTLLYNQKEDLYYVDISGRDDTKQ